MQIRDWVESLFVRKEMFNAHVQDNNLVKSIVFGMISMIVIAFFGVVIKFFITMPITLK
jgi:hypothetical protein